MIEQGSRWTSVNGKFFTVISRVVVEGNVWIYYRDNVENRPSNEYSCYEESFLSRFYPAPSESTRPQ
jgi:hypothetical protein